MPLSRSSIHWAYNTPPWPSSRLAILALRIETWVTGQDSTYIYYTGRQGVNWVKKSSWISNDDIYHSSFPSPGLLQKDKTTALQGDIGKLCLTFNNENKCGWIGVYRRWERKRSKIDRLDNKYTLWPASGYALIVVYSHMRIRSTRLCFSLFRAYSYHE